MENQPGGLAGHVLQTQPLQDLCISRAQQSSPGCAAAADSSCCSCEPSTCAAAWLLEDSKHPQGWEHFPQAAVSAPRPPGCVFGGSFTKAVSAGAHSGPSHITAQPLFLFSVWICLKSRNC